MGSSLRKLRHFIACLLVGLTVVLLVSFQQIATSLRQNLVSFAISTPQLCESAAFWSSDWKISAILDTNSLLAREKDAELLKQAIVEKYIKKARRIFLENGNKTNVKFLAYKCTSKKLCGGLGDRLRGVVGLFYLAMVSGRVFHIDWNRGSRLEDFFQVNSALYDVDQKLYNRKREGASSNQTFVSSRRFMNRGAEIFFFNWLAQPNFTTLIEPYSYFSLTTNFNTEIKWTLQLSQFNEFYGDLLSSFPRTQTLDLPIFGTAALRLIFGKPSKRLLKTFDKCVVNSTINWEKSYRIGVQVRRLQQSWGERGVRVSDNQISCFAEMTQQIVANLSATRFHFVVFVTADDESVAPFFLQHFANNSQISVISSEANCPHLKLTHLDRSKQLKNWSDYAKTYVDWLALTKMDQLIISRSGFAETASLFALKPTLRLDKSMGTNNSSSSCVFNN